MKVKLPSTRMTLDMKNSQRIGFLLTAFVLVSLCGTIQANCFWAPGIGPQRCMIWLPREPFFSE